MAKTANCPYCGAEMKVGGCDDYYWCICPECDSTSPVGYSRADALAKALHRAETLRAEWIPYGNDDECAECGNCGYLHQKYDLDGMETAHSYCPACGAKMELTGTKEEEQE